MIWQYRRFDVYAVNPPLTRLIAAFPAFVMGTVSGWATEDQSPEHRAEFSRGIDLVASHPDRWRTFVFAGRLLLIPFSVLGACVACRWAGELYGTRAACIAVVLWCFCPNLLAWNSVICSDGLATCFGLTAGYSFWRWLKDPHWGPAATAGGFLGMAQLSKMTWIILFLLWPFVWACCRRRDRAHCASVSREVLQLGTILLLGVYVLNLGYAFDNSFKELRGFTFFSAALSPTDSSVDEGRTGGNRFARSWLGRLPVPLPEDYLRGVDLQKRDFENGKPSFLLGEWSEHGWRHYYLVGLALKVPLGALCLGICAFVLRVWSFVSWRQLRHAGGVTVHEDPADQFVLLAPAVSLFAFVSAEDGFSAHFRYVLPALPFAFIWISKVGTAIDFQHPIRTRIVLGLTVAAVCSSVMVYPHSMSYFNALAGGPRNGHNFLRDSSFSWGQDIYYLRSWLKRHVAEELPFVSVSSPVPIEDFGIPSRGLSPGAAEAPSARDEKLGGPVPGWHAVDIQWVVDRKPDFGYFAQFKPVAAVGYSINIYFISLDDANRVRMALGCGVLESCRETPDDLLSGIKTRAGRRRPLRVAVFADEERDDGALEIAQELIDSAPHEVWKAIDAADIIDGRLEEWDLVVFGGGNAGAQATRLGMRGRELVREYVRNGGGYLGICAGGFLGSSTFDWGLSLVNAQCQVGTHYVPRFGQQMWLDRGRGDVELNLTPSGRQVFDSVKSRFSAQYTGGPIFLPGRRTYLCDYLPLAQYASEVCRFDFQRDAMAGKAAVVAAAYGAGKVILIGPHLEAMPELKPIVASGIAAVARSERDIAVETP